MVRLVPLSPSEYWILSESKCRRGCTFRMASAPAFSCVIHHYGSEWAKWRWMKTTDRE